MIQLERAIPVKWWGEKRPLEKSFLFNQCTHMSQDVLKHCKSLQTFITVILTVKIWGVSCSLPSSRHDFCWSFAINHHKFVVPYCVDDAVMNGHVPCHYKSNKLPEKKMKGFTVLHWLISSKTKKYSQTRVLNLLKNCTEQIVFKKGFMQ